ncbi:uncharacterized protein BX663DRAFT_436744, partial [Cokeromyces recurvatus]|uniref:uncharacterized protein n=1 Tax=Cokeromyces recurvatus TaxID=90255 RepID=UPI00221EDC6B
GYLPTGKLKLCLYRQRKLTKTHIIQCFYIHSSLHVPTTIVDPISYILNMLP